MEKILGTKPINLLLAIQKSNKNAADYFKGGWFGNYFAEKMKPGEQMTK